MSHYATNWAIKQRGLNAATKIVLWHLCDRYNPDFGCFPKQETLAEACEMSRSSINTHLKKLEELGLIRRQKRFDKQTKQQKSTRYILGFEPEMDRDNESRVQNLDTEAVSRFDQKPCPDLNESRVQNLDTNPVREPLIEPVNAQARASFSDFWENWPNKVAKVSAEKAWKKLTPQQKGEACEKCLGWFDWWRKENPTASPLHPASFLNARRWEDEPFTKQSQRSTDDGGSAARMLAECIIDRRPWVVTQISAAKARDMISQDLVTLEQCRLAGIVI
ncbi:MAG: helix-turn-helix domain-containing protein [Pseudomonadota bacterium]